MRQARIPAGRMLARGTGRSFFLFAGLMLLCAVPVQAEEVILHVDTPNITLVPGVIDYANDYIEVLGLNGVQVRVKTTAKTGAVLRVRTAGSPTGFRFGDLLTRTATPPGAGGTSLTGWTPLSPATISLWSSATSVPNFLLIQADIRIANLEFYDDGVTGGTTSYAEELTFTVVTP